MKTCNNCGLHFENTDQRGNCEGCAAELAAAAPVQRDPEVDALRRSLQQSNARVEQLQRSIQQPQQQPQQQQQPDRAEANRQAWQDPIAAMDYVATQRANQMAQAVMAQDQETMVELARDKARGTDPDDQRLFDKYQPEILERIGTYAPQLHRNPTLWKNVFNVIKGERLREIQQMERDGREDTRPNAPAVRIRNDGPAAPSTRQAPGSRKQEEISDEAKMVARNLGITNDQMAQGIKDFDNQGDPKDPTKPSSWDKVWSFSETTGKLGRKKAARQAALAGRA